MKHVAIAFGAAFSALMMGARGQGLLNIDPIFEDTERLPFSVSVNSSLGWDSQPGAGSSTRGNAGVSQDESGSAFWRNGINLYYPAGRGRNRFLLSANYSTTWYFDPPEGTQEFLNNGGVSADYFREINERLSIGNRLYLSYKTEPDYEIGTSINSPNSGYWMFSNRLWATWKWTTRLSAETSYNTSLVDYGDAQLASENYTQHLISQQFRYALTQRTTATFDYRYGFTQYEDNPAAESQSHYVLLGVNRPLGRFLSMSVRGGAEFRSYDSDLGSETSPYAEASINYLARKNTTFRLYYRRGLEDTGTAGQQSSDTQRVGLGMTQVLARGLSLSLNVDNVNSDYSGGGTADENTFHASAGLNYSRPLWRRVNFNASYSFSLASSDDPLNDYERHLASMGISCSF